MGFGFRNLDLYLEIKGYVKFLYNLSRLYPKEEIFGLRSQLSRAATSVLLNFAEGMMSPSSKERRRFLQICINSIGEIVAIGDLSLDLGVFTTSQHQEILIKSEDVIKRLYGLRRKYV
ncbi:four helix bundle protein [Candidatus Collierbacteria bacterium]|nr:four helix bundle protein [Candidatus Collierbacteria bacterium]